MKGREKEKESEGKKREAKVMCTERLRIKLYKASRKLISMTLLLVSKLEKSNQYI